MSGEVVTLLPLPLADVAFECASLQAADAPVRTTRCLCSGRDLSPD